MSVIINGILYEVGIASVVRSIRKEEKYRVTTEDGVVHREIRAVYIDFELSLGNFGSSEYDKLMAALLASDDVSVSLPSTSTTTETYTGAFDSIRDEICTQDADETIWDNLTLSFTGTRPIGGS